MGNALLYVGLLAASGQFVRTGLAAVDPDHRPWPPDELSAGFGLYWLLVMGMAASFFGQVATSSGSLYPVGGPSFVAGGVIFLAGAALNVLTADAMDEPAEIFGLEWRLHTTGPFRFSRHPQVAGHAAGIGGLAVAAGAWQALLLAVLIVGWFAVRPFAEEPVLARRFGDEFAEYRSAVARYVDLRRLGRLARER